MWTCSVCFIENTDDQLFCSNCGQERQHEDTTNVIEYSDRFIAKLAKAPLPIQNETSSTVYVIQRRRILSTSVRYYYGTDKETGKHQYVKELDYAYRFYTHEVAASRLYRLEMQKSYGLFDNFEFEILPVEIE